MIRWKTINDLVFKAKIGNRIVFKHLFEAYTPLMESLFRSFVKKYPFLDAERLEIIRNYYMWFWDAIREYEFNGEYGFSYFAKNKLIESFMWHIEKRYGIKRKKMPSIEEIERIMATDELVQEKKNRHRKIMNALKGLSTEQLQAVYLHIYKKNRVVDCAEIVGINFVTFAKRLRLAYRNTSHIYYGVVSKDNHLKEKIYWVHKQKQELKECQKEETTSRIR